jgi:hypothetical protein
MQAKIFYIPEKQPQDVDPTVILRTAWLDESVFPSAPYFELLWTSREFDGPPEHCHDFDEYLGYIGSDPENPLDLGCDFEIVIGDEVVKTNRSCLIFIPAGTKHCPMRASNMKRPIIGFTGAGNVNYLRKYENGTYRKN